MAIPQNKPQHLTGNILIVHQQIKVRSQLRRIVSLEGYKVFEAEDIHAAIPIAIRDAVEVILIDIDGQDNADPEDKKDLFQYAEVITLPPMRDIQEDAPLLLNIIDTALEKTRLEKRVMQFEEWVGPPPDIDQIIGESSIIRETIALARKISLTSDAVLLQGEMGTGKELFARAIHNASERRHNPFVILNCKAYTGTALEIELFGCRQGAYPGTAKDRTGALEKACKGSLLLTDIDSLDIPAQQKLLHALAHREFVRAGDTRPTPINIRLFSTTKMGLHSVVREKNFDEDLFYRLSLFTLNIPPLRERKMDIPLLSRRFMRHFARKNDKRIKDMNKDFLYHLQKYSWKGNIRELKNVMERAVIMAEGDILSEDSLPFDIRCSQDSSPELTSAFDLKNMEKLHLQKVLKYTRGNKVEAAKLLNIGLTTLYRKMNEYDYSN